MCPAIMYVKQASTQFTYVVVNLEAEKCTVAYNLDAESRRAKLGQIQGGLQRAIQDSTKVIIFYFLRVKNRTF